MPKKAEHLVLPGPIRRLVAEASDAHAVGEPIATVHRLTSLRTCPTATRAKIRAETAA